MFTTESIFGENEEEEEAHYFFLFFSSGKLKSNTTEYVTWSQTARTVTMDGTHSRQKRLLFSLFMCTQRKTNLCQVGAGGGHPHLFGHCRVYGNDKE